MFYSNLVYSSDITDYTTVTEFTRLNIDRHKDETEQLDGRMTRKQASVSIAMISLQSILMASKSVYEH